MKIKNPIMSFFRKKSFQTGAKILFELIIVFFGVLFAFMASDLRIKGSEKQRFKKTIEVLQHEITNFVTYSPEPLKAMKDSLQNYYVKKNAGEYPPPAYYREPRASGPPTAAWEALMASGAYEILDPELFYEMTIYYNRVFSINTKFKRYMILCEERILPHINEAPLVFYNDGKIKGEYHILILLLDEIVSEIEQLSIDAKELLNKLDK